MDGNGFRLGMKPGTALSLCAALFMLPGCSEPEALTPHELSAAVATNIQTTLPDVGALRIPLAGDGFHTVGFMALGDCELQLTLGKYQSSLGRRASDSQRLLLDLEFLRLAPPCIDRKRRQGQAELATVLDKINRLKKQQLAGRVFNATLANTEFQQFWRNTLTLGKTKRQQQLTLTALQAINHMAHRWRHGDYRASNLQFEIYLSEIASGGSGHFLGPDHETRNSIVQLEQQLAAVLPPEYSLWKDARDACFARLAASIKLD